MEVATRQFLTSLACSLCTNPFISPYTLTECGHTFCQTCLMKELKESRKCPTCKVIVLIKGLKRNPMVSTIVTCARKMHLLAKNTPKNNMIETKTPVSALRNLKIIPTTTPNTHDDDDEEMTTASFLFKITENVPTKGANHHLSLLHKEEEEEREKEKEKEEDIQIKTNLTSVLSTCEEDETTIITENVPFIAFKPLSPSVKGRNNPKKTPTARTSTKNSIKTIPMDRRRTRSSNNETCSDILIKEEEVLPASTPPSSIGRKTPTRSSFKKQQEQQQHSSASKKSRLSTLQVPIIISSSQTPPILLASGLDTDQKAILASSHQQISPHRSTLCLNYTRGITHIITPPQAQRTVKYLCGIIEGKWIVTWDWYLASLSADKFVEETTYLTEGPDGAVAKSLAAHQRKDPPLFNGMQFFLAGTFAQPAPSKSDLSNLIILGGGKIQTRRPRKAEETTIATEIIVIYDPERMINKDDWWWNLCRVKKPFTWLLDCISSYSISL